jgi:archaellum component FlaC
MQVQSSAYKHLRSTSTHPPLTPSPEISPPHSPAYPPPSPDMIPQITPIPQVLTQNDQRLEYRSLGQDLQRSGSVTPSDLPSEYMIDPLMHEGDLHTISPTMDEPMMPTSHNARVDSEMQPGGGNVIDEMISKIKGRNDMLIARMTPPTTRDTIPPNARNNIDEAPQIKDGPSRQLLDSIDTLRDIQTAIGHLSEDVANIKLSNRESHREIEHMSELVRDLKIVCTDLTRSPAIQHPRVEPNSVK